MVHTWLRSRPALVGAAACALALAVLPGLASPTEANHQPDPGCPPLPPASEFVAKIDNPYFPLEPGTTFIYEGYPDGEYERVVVEVTHNQKVVLGIAAVEVRDTVWVDGELAEDTLDWYAQDKAGNVWYLGEDTKEYEDGEVATTAGSWEAGKNGAMAGYIMEANPTVGHAYGQECAPLDEAEDRAEVLGVDASVSVPAPFVASDSALQTLEWSLQEPDVTEQKYYIRGIGMVLEVPQQDPSGKLELIEIERPEGADDDDAGGEDADEPGDVDVGDDDEGELDDD